MNHKPRHSPWGQIDNCETIAPGIYRVSTSSHGGYILSPQRLAAMPKALRLHNDNHFEEDCEWCLVVLSFPDLFPDALRQEATLTCKNWYPHLWEAWTGTTLSLEESKEKARQHFHQQHAHDYVVITAWGDWHSQVPTHHVITGATLGGDRSKAIRYFLVPEQEYATRSSFGFVINPTLHPSVARPHP